MKKINNSPIQKSKKKFGRNMKEVMSYNTNLKNFKVKEKPPKGKEMGALEILLVNIRSKQKTENVPVYTPPEQLASKAIATEWEKLDKDMLQYEKVLRDAITRMKKLEALLERFNSQAGSILEWHNGKHAFLNEELSKKMPINTCKIKISMLNAHDEEQKNLEATQEGAMKIGQEVIDADHSAGDDIKDKNIQMKVANADSKEKSEEKMKKLKEILEFKEKIEKMCLDFAEKADGVNSEMQSDLLELSEPINCSTIADVDNALKYLDKMEGEHKERKPKINDCQKIYDEVKEFEDPETFASVGQKELNNKFEEEIKKIDERRKALGLEKKRIFDDLENQKKKLKKKLLKKIKKQKMTIKREQKNY